MRRSQTRHLYEHACFRGAKFNWHCLTAVQLITSTSYIPPLNVSSSRRDPCLQVVEARRVAVGAEAAYDISLATIYDGVPGVRDLLCQLGVVP